LNGSKGMARLNHLYPKQFNPSGLRRSKSPE
jgi:hypothetical protein